MLEEWPATGDEERHRQALKTWSRAGRWSCWS